MKSQRKENERDADMRRGPFGQGPRAFAKVVERVTDRLRSRIACDREDSEATTLADAVEKAWRKEYARPLPTQEDVDRKWSSIPRKIKRIKPRVPKAKLKPPPQKAPELSLGKPKRRFVLKTQSSSSQKYKRSRPSGNSNVPAEDCGSSETRKDVGDGTLPQESMGGEAEAGLKSDSFQARDRKQTGHGGCDQGDIGTAAGHNRTSDEQSGDESRVGLLTVASSTAARPPEREDGGVSTGEAGAGDDEDKRQEADPNPEREDGKASSPGQQVSANEYMNAASPGADARPAGEGHAEDEEDKDSAPPDVTVTANFVGQLKKGARYRRKRWKLELEGGAIETSESVFVFDKCECTFYSPWKH